jgi:predicted alpha-1,6-mannanase (GH76 family)
LSTIGPPASPAALRRRPWPGLPAAAIAAIVLAVLASALAGVKALATSGPANPQKADIAQLLRSYNAGTGLIGKQWWQSAVALSTVETYAQTTGDTSYDYAIAGAFAHHSQSDFENGSDDDTAWWGLAWLQAYDITHVPAYLSMAETDADYIHEDWDSTCGGGVWWQRNPRSYKNAISNELFLELTAWLHNTIHGDTKYLGWAESEWSWFDHSGMISKSGLVNDGLDNSCRNNGQTTWTYNQGVVLAGLAQLYLATGKQSLLTQAERIGEAAISHLTAGGVLTEPCEGPGCPATLSDDAQAFKGIFVRDLKVLAVTARTSQFNAFFAAQAKSIEASDTFGSQLGMSWSGPAMAMTPASQASALEALVADLKLP